MEQLLIWSLTCLYGFQDAFEMFYLEEEKGKKKLFSRKRYILKRERDVCFNPSDFFLFLSCGV